MDMQSLRGLTPHASTALVRVLWKLPRRWLRSRKWHPCEQAQRERFEVRVARAEANAWASMSWALLSITTLRCAHACVSIMHMLSECHTREHVHHQARRARGGGVPATRRAARRGGRKSMDALTFNDDFAWRFAAEVCRGGLPRRFVTKLGCGCSSETERGFSATSDLAV